MQGIGPFPVAIVFWIFVGTVAVAAIVSDYKRRRAGLDVLRQAIEKGQQLDPLLIDKLTSEQRGEPIDPVHVQLGGIITIAAGIGIGLLAYFISQIASKALYPILGVGVLAICVGIGLLIGAKVLVQARERPRNGGS
jgi:hypothetical protein